jgi:hypothetical protein
MFTNKGKMLLLLLLNANFEVHTKMEFGLALTVDVV